MDTEKLKEYLYFVMDTNTNTLVYIGKGVDNRYKHIFSGKSSCRFANEYYFNNNPNDLKVFIIPVIHSPLEYESALIFFCQPEWNVCSKQEYPQCSSIVINSSARFSMWLNDFRVLICSSKQHIAELMMTSILHGEIDEFKNTYRYYDNIKHTHYLLPT